MSAPDSDCFPRGGKRIVQAENVKRKPDDNLFKIDTQPKAKKPRKEKNKAKREVVSDSSWQSALKLQGTLSYNKIQDGMVVLGCIRHFSNLALQVEFPGLTFGQVTINCISDAFTETITESLRGKNAQDPSSLVKTLFELGQLIPTKIMSVQHSEKGFEIHASINPNDINADKMHTSFLKGATIWAAISSKLDHGYELSLGVKNCRVFLPFKNVDDSIEYSIGKPLYCVVHKAEHSNVATTLTVSAKKEHLDKIQISEETNLQHIIPGTKVEFCVEQVLSHGIKGKFLENCFGYIDQSQLFSKTKLSKLQDGSLLPAYVLFVEPVTNITYLTLRNIETAPSPKLEVGQVIFVEVSSIFGKGLFLKLGKTDTGFVTNKRLLNTLPKLAELDIVDAVRKKYPVGSRHSCRILDYNRMQQLYICTFEQSLIKEKIFSVKDLKLGQNASVKVEKIVHTGLIVSAGHIQGFVPNLHLSNTKFSEGVKARYSVGMTVNARVLNITDEQNVVFTLKNGLVESDNCLVNIEDASVNTQYVGFVVQTKISGALIAFYGNAKGWISNRELNSGNLGKYSDPREYFFRGQVVNVWTLGLKSDKLQVTLNAPDGTKKRKLRLGDRLNGTITAVTSSGLDVEVGKQKVSAVVPLAHLCSNISLCPLLLKTYKVGDPISNVLCVKNKDIPVLSNREYLALSQYNFKIPKMRDLKKGMVLRCSFENDIDSGIYVSTPILDFQDKILISNKNLFGKDEICPVFQKNQSILAKILRINYEENSIILGARPTQILTNDLNKHIDSLSQTLEDLSAVSQFGRENNWNLTQYDIGQRVQCIVKKNCDSGKLLVTLPNGSNGFVAPGLFDPNLQPESTAEGVVIDYNFVDDCVEICLRNDLKQKINKTQDGIIKKSLQSSCSIQKLLTTRFYILAVLKDGDCNRQLVYLPLYYADKNRQTIHPVFAENKFKVIAHRKVCNKIIVIPKKLISLLKKESKVDKEKVKDKKPIPKKVIENIESDEGCSMEVDDDINEDDIVSNDEVIAKDESSDEEESEDDEEKDKSLVIVNKKTSSTPLLSGVNSFYTSVHVDNVKDEESSSDEEEQSEENNKKKKKLTPAERADLAKKEEERIAKIEKELADTSSTPQTAEQFDRLLLANPNSSELWLKYIAMHVATTELDKARTVANRALETINMTLIKEKFNIWIALLNLENMYGTKESFDQVFENAVKFNDALDIYLSVIKLLASSGKLVEMEEKIRKIRAKERQNTKMWLEIGQAYYSLEKYKEARNIKEAALKSILDHKRQFDLIVKFGIMEFQSGELEQAIANFETILNTYPAKINIWIIYVDQLVKKKKIEEARNVLERAVGQKFAVKSMKAIIQKFISFEEQHGTAEMIEEVKRKAKEYVKSIGVR